AERLLRQIDEPYRCIDLLNVEKFELLLIAEHFERRFAKHGKEECGPVWACQREHDLMRERRLAGPRRAGNEIERELRHAAAQDAVESRNACRQAADRNLVGHVVSSVVSPSKSSAHASRKRCVVRLSSMNRWARVKGPSSGSAARTGASPGTRRCARYMLRSQIAATPASPMSGTN